MVSDLAGYRYQASHPETGKAWPAMPEVLLDLWAHHAGYPHPPEACLVNFYQQGAKMGLHQDKDEEDFAAPVLSGLAWRHGHLRFGGAARVGKTETLNCPRVMCW